MAANQIDSEQAFSGVAQTANIGSSTSVSSGAAKIFREFKWGLLTLFILMTVVVCLVYDGGRGKKKTDLAQAKPSTGTGTGTGSDSQINAEILPSTGSNALGGSSDSTALASNGGTNPLTSPDRTASHSDEAPDRWHTDATPGSPLHHLPESSNGSRLPDIANDGQASQQTAANDKPQRSGRASARSTELRETTVRVSERETSSSTPSGAFKWYTVKTGDNLTRIANANLPGKGGNKAILEANKDTLPEANRLREGMKIRIPNSLPSVAASEVSEKKSASAVNEKRSDSKTTVQVSEKKGASNLLTQDDYLVVTGDTLEKIARKVLNDSHKWKELLDWNKDRISEPSKLRVGMILRTHPTGQTPTVAPVDALRPKQNTVRADADSQKPLPSDPQTPTYADDVTLPIHPIAANATSPAHKGEKSEKCENAKLHKTVKSEAIEKQNQDDDAILKGL